MSRRASTG